MVLGQIKELDCTTSYAQANRMHKDFLSSTLSDESIAEMMSADKPNRKPVYRISAERFGKYITPGTPPKEAEEYLLKACEHYERSMKRRRNIGAR